MKYIKWLAVLFLGLTLTGCALMGNNTTVTTTTERQDGTKVTTTIDAPTENMVYQQQVGQDSGNDAAMVAAQAQAISTASDCPTCSSDAQAILKFSAGQQIANLKTSPYSGKAPTGGWDVAKSLADQATDIAKASGLTYVGAKAVDAVGNLLENAGDRTNIKMGDGNTVQGFEKTVIDQEIHATAIGENSNPVVGDSQAGETPSVNEPAETEETEETAESEPEETEE